MKHFCQALKYCGFSLREIFTHADILRALALFILESILAGIMAYLLASYLIRQVGVDDLGKYLIGIVLGMMLCCFYLLSLILKARVIEAYLISQNTNRSTLSVTAKKQIIGYALIEPWLTLQPRNSAGSQEAASRRHLIFPAMLSEQSNWSTAIASFRNAASANPVRFQPGTVPVRKITTFLLFLLGTVGAVVGLVLLVSLTSGNVVPLALHLEALGWSMLVFILAIVPPLAFSKIVMGFYQSDLYCLEVFTSANSLSCSEGIFGDVIKELN